MVKRKTNTSDSSVGELSTDVYQSEDDLAATLSRYLLIRKDSTLVQSLVAVHTRRDSLRSVRLEISDEFFGQLVRELLRHWSVKIVDSDDKGDQLTQNAQATINIPPLYTEIMEGVRHFNYTWDIPAIVTYFIQKAVYDSTLQHVQTIGARLLLFVLSYPKWRDFNNIWEFLQCALFITDVAKRSAVEEVYIWTCFENEGQLQHLFTEDVEPGTQIENPWSGSHEDKYCLVRVQEPKDLVVANTRFEAMRYHISFGVELTSKAVELYAARLAPQTQEGKRATSLLEEEEEEEYQVPLSNIYQFMRNLYYVNQLSLKFDAEEQCTKEIEKLENCLLYRWRRLSEEEIAAKLDMTFEDYVEWSEENHVNIIFRQKDKVYDDWKTAETSLGIPVPQQKAKPTQHDQSSDSEKPNRFRQVGDYWDICYNGKEVRLSDKLKVGPPYIRFLLAHPSSTEKPVDIPAFELQQLVEGNITDTPASKMLDSLTSDELETIGLTKETKDNPYALADPDTKKAVKRRIDDIENVLPGVKDTNPEKYTELNDELQWHKKFLGSLRDYFGRDQTFSDRHGKAQDKIRKAIRRTIDAIRIQDKALANHLDICIKRGDRFSYHPQDRIDWVL